MFGIFPDISYFCSLLQNITEFCRTLLQNIIVEYKKIDYGKNDKRNGSAGLSHP